MHGTVSRIVFIQNKNLKTVYILVEGCYILKIKKIDLIWCLSNINFVRSIDMSENWKEEGNDQVANFYDQNIDCADLCLQHKRYKALECDTEITIHFKEMGKMLNKNLIKYLYISGLVLIVLVFIIAVILTMLSKN